MGAFEGRRKEIKGGSARNATHLHSKPRVATVALQDNRPQSLSQQKLQAVADHSRTAIQRRVIQMKEWYAYGSAKTPIHVHCYNGGSHLKIPHRGSIKRYNIVQNGRVHNQAQDALDAAEGNDTLVGVIQRLIEAVTGVSLSESQTTEPDDKSPDDFTSMDAMWKKIGWDLKGGEK